MASPNLIPNNNYATGAVSNFAQVVNADAPAFFADGSTPYYHMQKLGLPQFLIHDVRVAKYGRQLPFIPVLLRDMFGPIRPQKNYVGTRQTGREVLVNGQVRSTVSADGSGLDRVQLKVAFEGGAAGQFLSVGTMISSTGRREFRVIDQFVDTDGFQVVTVQPNDGRYNLIVTGGVCRQFPNDSLLGIRGTTKSYGQSQQFFQTLTGGDQAVSWKMTRKFMDFRRDLINLQNDILTRAVVPWLEVPNPDSPMQNIGYFYTESETKEMYRFFADCNYHMFYGEEINDPNSTFLQGAGLKNQIPAEFRRPYVPQQINKLFLQNLLYDYRVDNPDKSGTQMLVCGDRAYQDIHSMLDSEFPVQRRTEPVRPGENGRNSKFDIEFNNYGRVTDVFGSSIQIINLSELSVRRGEALRSPNNPNVSIAAHDIFVLDPAPISNINLSTGTMEQEADRKLNIYCAMNPDGSPDSLRDTYLATSVDQMGNAIASGPVASFEEFTTRRLVNTFAVELADKKSARYYYLG